VGNQNGIRPVPLLPTLNVLARACQQNVAPGINVFDKVNSADGITCANPPTQTISSTNVTFTGTRSNPESLVIDNQGMGTVQITGSLPGNNTLTCNTLNLNSSNWGLILATGDLSLQGNFVFTGFIYTPGNIFTSGNTLLQGGVFSGPIQGSSEQDEQGDDNENDAAGTANFCGGSTAILLLNPQFFNFTTISWQDVPLNQP